MSDKTFGERLVAERKRLGLSATDVFEATGLHRNTQSAYENDKKRRLGVESLIPHRIKFQKFAR